MNRLNKTKSAVLLYCRLSVYEGSVFQFILTSYTLLKKSANCVRFYLNRFCCEVNEGCLPHDKINLDKSVHYLQLASIWRSLKTRPEHCILIFMYFTRYKKYLWIWGDFFNLHIQSPVQSFV